jgi:hypothetical protein
VMVGTEGRGLSNSGMRRVIRTRGLSDLERVTAS